MVASGQEVTVGDEVALEFHPDEVGVITGVHAERGLPVVEIIEGPNLGKVLPMVFHAQILRKRVGG
jgi:hypothetical protein